MSEQKATCPTLQLFDIPPSFSGKSPRLRQRAHFRRLTLLTANAALTSLNALSAQLSHPLPNLYDIFAVNSSSNRAKHASIPLSMQGFNFLHQESPIFNATQSARIQQFVLAASRTFVRRALEGSGGDHSSIVDSSPITYTNASSVAVPLQADKVSLPEAAGTVNLLDVLPPAVAARLRSPSPDLLVRDEPTRSVAPLLNCSRGEYVRLLQRMRGAGMLDFTTQPRVVNGIFAVDKDGGQAQRLIINAIPANTVFADPPRTELPNPELIAALVLERAAQLYVAKCDISNYYHQLALPDWLRPFFALPPVRRDDLGLDGDADERVWPCCRTLPMGWSWSVFLAQQAHLNILSQSSDFPASASVCRSNDSRVDRARFLVYIDDVAFFASDEVSCRRLQDSYLRICERWNLHVKLSKTVRPSILGVEVLGVLVDGFHRVVGVSPQKLARLVQRTTDVLHRGSATGLEIEQLLGSWSWSFLVRRPAFATFSAAYRFAAIAKRRTFSIWPSVRDELLIACGLAPLLFATLDSPLLDRVVASDASETGLGVAAARSDVSVVAQLVDLLPPQPVPEIDSSASDLLAALRWRTIASSRWQRAEHIAIGEARAATTATRWVASLPAAAHARILLLLDSAAVAGAVSKGRSSNFTILRSLRRISAIALSRNCRFVIRWIPSALNAADHPSRA
jgi:hypothetical protein